MKIHLRILYGCDDRLSYTKDCIEVSRPYFDTIGITNTGPIEFYQKLKETFDENVLIRHHQNFMDIESSRRLLLDDVPWDDWVLWLDADERPSPDLLENIRRITVEADSEGIRTIKLVWFEHCEGNPTPPDSSRVPKNHDEYMKDSSGVFCPSRLIKKCKDLQIKSNFGAHECFDGVNNKQKYYPYFVIHNKAHIMYYQSIVFSGFFNPIVHSNANFQGLSKFLKSSCYKNLEQFQIKHKTFVSNDLVRKLKIEKDMSYKEELKNLFLSFPSESEKDSEESITFRFMNTFAKKYDLDVESPYYKCGNPCCKYKNVQL